MPDPDALSRLRELDARYLWISYHDYSGVARAKAVPSERFEDAVERGVTFATANWDLVLTGQQVPDSVFALDSGDFHVIPEARSMVPVPYRDGVVQAYGRLVDGSGAPWAGDPRARLLAQVDVLSGLDLTVQVAFEAEFSLVISKDGRYELADHGRMFTTDEIEARWPLVQRWLETLSAMGIAVHQVAKEWGPAQYELSLFATDPLTAVEQYLQARQVIRAISRRSGIHATFMPKPFSDVPGNGLHVHISLARRGGSDAVGGDREETISSTGEAAIAGLLAHASGQSAISAASPNSYKRLAPGTGAPVHVCWDFGNRAALVRIPGPGDSRRFEVRAGDATANAYMLVTGLLAGIAHGVRDELTPPPAAMVDVGRLSDAEAEAAGFARLPTDLSSALEAFEADETLATALGPIISTHYPPVKRLELDLYRAGGGGTANEGDVTDWERATYLEHV